MTKPVKFSVIIPTKKLDQRIKQELIPALAKQNFKDFEVIIVTDKDQPGGPAAKRDWATKQAKGKLLAFIDSDAYPAQAWLKNSLSHFKSKTVAAVAGPGITPPEDNLWQQVSGWVWQTWLGAGGAGTYRCQPTKQRLVDDYPTFNLIVRKTSFDQIGGFDCQFWPGEDTKLCQALVYRLGQKIIYDPRVLVYHHRRPIFLGHLQQVARFGQHRGYFVKRHPQTSKRLSYFMPSILVLWLLTLGLICPVTLLPYWLWLWLTGFMVSLRSRKLLIGILLIPTIFLTHVVYGVMFMVGLLSRYLPEELE